MTMVRTMPVSSPSPAPRPLGRHALDLRSHRNLRGPYTAGGELLRRVVPELMSVDPALVKPTSMAIIAIAPDLESDVPIRPQTLTDLAQGEERTRFYPVQRTRNLAFMISELVNGWARACHPEGVTLRFWELPDADPTDVQLFRTLQRRSDPASVEVVDSGVPGLPGLPGRDGGSPDPAQRYVDADGTSADPAERAAYEKLTDADRGARHTKRSQLLIAQAQPGTQLGAIPYHLERGDDSSEAVPWLIAGLDLAHREGFYEAALDLGLRGRALLPRAQDPKTLNYLTKKVISALTSLSRCDEAMQLIEEHRRTSTEPVEQMNCAYMMAMIYTRFLEPARRDQDLALSWSNTAIALAGGAPPDKRAFCSAFMRNARALVELHRGNLIGATDLVNEAIEIADGKLDPEQHQLHRTVLINNRARLLLALKDHDGAIAAYDEVLTRDPEYDEPYFDRATAHRARGDLGAALRDLDHAIELNVAFADAYYNRADIRLELGEEEPALADLNTVLDIDPDHTDALLSRAAMLIDAGDLDAAAADVARGLSISPQHASLWSAKGMIRGERGAEAEALECYAIALAMDPQLAEVYGNRAVLHFTAGRAIEALADLDRAIALRDTAVLRVNRGIALQALGDDETAIRDLDAALAMPGADAADVLFRRGQSHHALGNGDLASADWDRHLKVTAERGELSEHADEIAKLRAGDSW
jgi:tetratricopeptide (TPR) repeat protein